MILEWKWREIDWGRRETSIALRAKILWKNIAFAVKKINKVVAQI